MTWGMFLLGWLDLGNEAKATELFERSILNVQQPFYVSFVFTTANTDKLDHDLCDVKCNCENLLTNSLKTEVFLAL